MPDLNLFGEPVNLEPVRSGYAPPAQEGLFELAPASTFAAGETLAYGPAPDALETLPLTESMRAPHRVRRSR